MSLSLTEANLDSLIFANWSFPTGSLTLDNLSRKEDRLQSLTLQSLSLNHENGFQRMSFKQVSLQDGSLKELEEHLANQHSKKRAETNSFSQESFPKDQLEDKRAKTNGFSTHSFSQRILSLQMCLLIFLFGSFYLAGAALYLTTCSFKISLTTESLQQEELAAAYCNKSFQQESLQQDELQTAYLHQLDRDTSLSFHCFSLPRCSKITLESFNQLDPVQSLSFQMLGSTSVSYQLQADSFHRISFELRASICAALFQTIRFRNRQLQSFQLTGFQLSNALASGGVQQTTSHHQLSSFDLDSFEHKNVSLDLAQLELSTWCFQSLFKQDSLETCSSSTRDCLQHLCQQQHLHKEHLQWELCKQQDLCKQHLSTDQLPR